MNFGFFMPSGNSTCCRILKTVSPSIHCLSNLLAANGTYAVLKTLGLLLAHHLKGRLKAICLKNKRKQRLTLNASGLYNCNLLASDHAISARSSWACFRFTATKWWPLRISAASFFLSSLGLIYLAATASRHFLHYRYLGCRYLRYQHRFLRHYISVRWHRLLHDHDDAVRWANLSLTWRAKVRVAGSIWWPLYASDFISDATGTG